MGNFAVSALKVINCDTCAKYVYIYPTRAHNSRSN